MRSFIRLPTDQVELFSAANQKSISSARDLVFLVICLIASTVIVARLWQLQVLQAEVFQDLANRNRYFREPTVPERGLIYDRYNQPLTVNKKAFIEKEDPAALYSVTARITDEAARSIIATNEASLGFVPERVYPLGSALAHVLGYVGLPTTRDIVQDSQLLRHQQVGKSGLERIFEQRLRGSSGSLTYEINAQGRKQRLLSEQVSTPGQSVYTSIDPFITLKAAELLDSHIGSVVVLDAETSAVLTMISSPSFDPNDLSQRLAEPEAESSRRARVSEALSHPDQAFLFRAVSGLYPPGSVFKPIVALAALESGVIDSATTVRDEGFLEIGEYRFANWYFTSRGGVDGDIAVGRALARSNDIFFYRIAEMAGPFAMAEMAKRFGFATTTGIEVIGEAAGTIPDPDWKLRVLNEPWYLGNSFHMGIGQGDVLITPLQVAQQYQALAARGQLCRPRLEQTPTPNRDCTELGIREDDLQIVLEGLLDACSPGGTASRFFSHNTEQRKTGRSAYQQLDDGAFACKTGTAEFGGQNDEGRRNTHAWFALVGRVQPNSVRSAEITDPQESDVETDHLHDKWKAASISHPLPEKLVFVAMVESDVSTPFREGSREAAGIVADLIDWLQR